MKRTLGTGVMVACALLLAGQAWAQTDIAPHKGDLPAPPRPYSPYVERAQPGANFAEGVFWGDTHLHTGYSTDAGMIGTTLTPVLSS